MQRIKRKGGCMTIYVAVLRNAERARGDFYDVPRFNATDDELIKSNCRKVMWFRSENEMVKIGYEWQEYCKLGYRTDFYRSGSNSDWVESYCEYYPLRPGDIKWNKKYISYAEFEMIKEKEAV
jgi:hypothetical protein